MYSILNVDTNKQLTILSIMAIRNSYILHSNLWGK